MHRCSPLHNQGFDSWNGRRGCHWYPFAPPHYGATSRRGSSRPLDASHVIVVYSLQHAIWIYMIHVVSCSIVYSSYYIQYILCYCVLTCVWSPTGPHDWQTILDLILTTKKNTISFSIHLCALQDRISSSSSPTKTLRCSPMHPGLETSSSAASPVPLPRRPARAK